MKIPYSWLRELCPTRLTPEDLAVTLTEHGIEVDAVVRPWAGLTGVVTARVEEVRDHPNADKLCVVSIETGGGERQVVAGVRNMRAGDLVPYAPPGATLPGFEGPLERRKLRGEPSEGMVCSPKELGISADHSGILILPETLAAEPGADLAEVLGLDEAVLDIDVFPNRPDLLSVLGLAREVAAITGEELRPPDTSVAESEEKAADAATVEILDMEGCPRYLARVIRGVARGPSPLWAQVRLTAAGMRPVSGVVDATNYALLEMGHPMHPFDLAALRGPGIVVRRAEEGERLVTLDDVERALAAEDLLIADTERAVAVAGVIGGAETEVGEETSDVLLESAFFDPRAVLRTARRLGLRTEASFRFERGADPEALASGASMAARLIVEWAGGAVLRGEIDVGAAPPRRTVSVRPERAAMLLGTPTSAEDIVETFRRLGIEARAISDAVEIEAPGYRVDLAIEADLIEEVGRIHGYEHLPSTLPGVKLAGGLTREQRLRRRVQDALARAGVHQIHSVSFASSADLALFEDGRGEGVRVSNPVSEEEGYLRSSLLPGLLRAAALSVGHRRPSVRLFETGHVMWAGAEEPVEQEAAAALMTGPAEEEWPAERDAQGYLHAKGVLERLLAELGVATWTLGEAAGAPYHPGRSAIVLIEGERAGEIGELHPGVAESFDLEGRVAAFELRTGALVASAHPDVEAEAPSRYPPVRRDVAFVVDRDVRAGAVRALLREAAGDLLERVVLFDVFEGGSVPEGRKSLAFALDLRAADRTLTDEEANEVVDRIAARLAEDLGAELRAG